MINHRERFLQRCSKKYKDEMTTDWIFANPAGTLRLRLQSRHPPGKNTFGSCRSFRVHNGYLIRIEFKWTAT